MLLSVETTELALARDVVDWAGTTRNGPSHQDFSSLGDGRVR
jgi:hypothetical protein